MDIQRLLKFSKFETEADRLGMILGNRIDMGSSEGGLISGKQFPVLVEDLKAWRQATTPALTWFRWDTDIGEILACAATVALAREQVMLTLSKDDAAHGELEVAIAPEPQTLGDQPRAFVNWHG